MIILNGGIILTKKILSLVLAITMLMSMVTIGIVAVSANTGTPTPFGSLAATSGTWTGRLGYSTTYPVDTYGNVTVDDGTGDVVYMLRNGNATFTSNDIYDLGDKFSYSFDYYLPYDTAGIDLVKVSVGDLVISFKTASGDVNGNYPVATVLYGTTALGTEQVLGAANNNTATVKTAVQADMTARGAQEPNNVALNRSTSVAVTFDNGALLVKSGDITIYEGTLADYDFSAAKLVISYSSNKWIGAAVGKWTGTYELVEGTTSSDAASSEDTSSDADEDEAAEPVDLFADATKWSAPTSDEWFAGVVDVSSANVADLNMILGTLAKKKGKSITFTYGDAVTLGKDYTISFTTAYNYGVTVAETPEDSGSEWVQTVAFGKLELKIRQPKTVNLNNAYLEVWYDGELLGTASKSLYDSSREKGTALDITTADLTAASGTTPAGKIQAIVAAALGHDNCGRGVAEKVVDITIEVKDGVLTATLYDDATPVTFTDEDGVPVTISGLTDSIDNVVPTVTTQSGKTYNFSGIYGLKYIGSTEEDTTSSGAASSEDASSNDSSENASSSAYNQSLDALASADKWEIAGSSFYPTVVNLSSVGIEDITHALSVVASKKETDCSFTYKDKLNLGNKFKIDFTNAWIYNMIGTDATRDWYQELKIGDLAVRLVQPKDTEAASMNYAFVEVWYKDKFVGRSTTHNADSGWGEGTNLPLTADMFKKETGTIRTLLSTAAGAHSNAGGFELTSTNKILDLSLVYDNGTVKILRANGTEVKFNDANEELIDEIVLDGANFKWVNLSWNLQNANRTWQPAALFDLDIEYYVDPDAPVESEPIELGTPLTEEVVIETITAADFIGDTSSIIDGYVYAQNTNPTLVQTKVEYDLGNAFQVKSNLTFANGYTNYYGGYAGMLLGDSGETLELRVYEYCARTDHDKENCPNNPDRHDETMAAMFDITLYLNGQEIATHDMTSAPNGEYILKYDNGKVTVLLNEEAVMFKLSDGTKTTTVNVGEISFAKNRIGLRMSGNYHPNPDQRGWSTLTISPLSTGTGSGSGSGGANTGDTRNIVLAIAIMVGSLSAAGLILLSRKQRA